MGKMKKVNKHWGYELWIADGSVTPYAFKEIFFKAGKRTSLQVHKYKIETNYVSSGTGIMICSKEPLDIDAFLEQGMTNDEIEEYVESFDVIMLEPGVSVTVMPGTVHRVIATTDLVFFETSSTELDDVIRLQDDANRQHGRIDDEHR